MSGLSTKCKYGAHFRKDGRVEWKEFAVKKDSGMYSMSDFADIVEDPMNESFASYLSGSRISLKGKLPDGKNHEDVDSTDDDIEIVEHCERLDDVLSSHSEDEQEIEKFREDVAKRKKARERTSLETTELVSVTDRKIYGGTMKRRSPSELFLASKYENNPEEEEQRLSEFENLSENIYHLYEDILECVKRSSTLREVKDGIVVPDNPFTPKYQSGGFFYYEESLESLNKLEPIKRVTSSKPETAQESHPTDDPFIGNLGTLKKKSRRVFKPRNIVIPEHPSLSTLKRKDFVLRSERDEELVPDAKKYISETIGTALEEAHDKSKKSIMPPKPKGKVAKKTSKKTQHIDNEVESGTGLETVASMVLTESRKYRK